MRSRHTRLFLAVGVVFLTLSIASAQYQNVRVSLPSASDPEEVSISINPANTLNLAAGANIDYYYYSTNGGLNWSQGTLTSTYGVWGDPCLVYDGEGNLYFVSHGSVSNSQFETASVLGSPARLPCSLE